MDELERHFGRQLSVVCGGDGFDPTISLEVSHPRLQYVRNHFFLGRRLLWQSRVCSPCFRAGIVATDLNPRILSTWVILGVRRMLSRPTILWGHAWPRRGREARTDTARHAMRRLADAVLVYTDSEARELRSRMPHAVIEAAPNGLYPRSQAGPAIGPTQPLDFVFVGRLVKPKKPELLLEAFLEAMDELPSETRLVFVGAGPLRASLERRASRAGGRVHFMGAVYDHTRLAAIYERSLASVSPGTAGLSLTQSLWFGVPALIARDELHGPELEAAVEGENAYFFDSDSVRSLCEVMLRVARERSIWHSRRVEIARACAKRYSIEAMVAGVLDVIATVSRGV